MLQNPMPDRSNLLTGAVEKIKLTRNPALREAAILAAWMIVEKGFVLKSAARSASKKHGSSQASIVRLIKTVLPLWLLDENARKASAFSIRKDICDPQERQAAKKVDYALVESDFK